MRPIRQNSWSLCYNFWYPQPEFPRDGRFPKTLNVLQIFLQCALFAMKYSSLLGMLLVVWAFGAVAPTRPALRALPQPASHLSASFEWNPVFVFFPRTENRSARLLISRRLDRTASVAWQFPRAA
jgi:hypothetical protein